MAEAFCIGEVTGLDAEGEGEGEGMVAFRRGGGIAASMPRGLEAS